MFPSIYSLIFAPTIGELGNKTKVEDFSECPDCKRRKRPLFTFIEYRFDRWAGEDLVSAMGNYAVSERLKQILEESNISGIEFENMKVSRGSGFEITSEAYSKTLPKFYRLVITGRALGPEFWWKSWSCEKCGLKHWDITDFGIKAKVAHLTSEVGTPREVFKDSWQGHDVFHLEDPGLPVVTQKFVDLIQEQGVIGAVFHPAKWVEPIVEE